MQKGFAQLLIPLVIITIIGGLFFYFSFQNNNSLSIPKIIPSPQPEFNSYSNPGLGFEFKTNKDLIVKEDTETDFNKRGNGDFRKNFAGYVGYEPAEVIGAIAVLDKSDSFEINPFSVWVFNNDNNQTTEQWFDKYWYYPFVWGVFDYTSKGHIAFDQEATISGQPARYKIISYQSGAPKFMYVSKDQKMYLFRIIGAIGERILSTVKLLSVNNCRVTGCSGQICTDQEVVTTCEMLPEYQCYKQAQCERQSNGQCGWTQTDQLTKCLKKHSTVSKYL